MRDYRVPAMTAPMANLKLLLAAAVAPVILLSGAVLLFSPLRVFSALVPTDGGVELVARSTDYGAETRQKLDIYRPANTQKALPVLVFAYGGGWDSGERGLYEFAGRSFANAGYLTFVFDYRLVPETRFPGFVEDTAAAIAWASRHAVDYGGDGTRVYLVGHSAGAYNMAMVALDRQFFANQGLDPAVIGGVALLAGPYDFLPLDDPATIGAFSHFADAAATQPVNFVTGNAPPTLLIHGTADTTVWPRNSKALGARLEAAGVQYQLTEYDGLGHAEVLLSLSRPMRWRAPVLQDILAFFARHQAAGKRS